MGINDIIVTVTVFAALIVVMIQVKKLLDLRRASILEIILRNLTEAGEDDLKDPEKFKRIIKNMERDLDERRKK